MIAGFTFQHNTVKQKDTWPYKNDTEQSSCYWFLWLIIYKPNRSLECVCACACGLNCVQLKVVMPFMRDIFINNQINQVIAAINLKIMATRVHKIKQWSATAFSQCWSNKEFLESAWKAENMFSSLLWWRLRTKCRAGLILWELFGSLEGWLLDSQ